MIERPQPTFHHDADGIMGGIEHHFQKARDVNTQLGYLPGVFTPLRLDLLTSEYSRQYLIGVTHIASENLLTEYLTTLQDYEASRILVQNFWSLISPDTRTNFTRDEEYVTNLLRMAYIMADRTSQAMYIKAPHPHLEKVKAICEFSHFHGEGAFLFRARMGELPEEFAQAFLLLKRCNLAQY